MPKSILLSNWQAPGDLIVLTAAVRDLQRCYPGQFAISVETSQKHVWDNNPYIVPVANRKTASEHKMMYDMVHRSDEYQLHFLQGFIADLNAWLKLQIRLTEFRPDLHFSEQELFYKPIEGDYWIILSGGKADFTTKLWDPQRYQEVVDRLHGKVNFVQLGGGLKAGGAKHFHRGLNGVTNLVGQTSFREALVLLRHARGIICPITAFMHAAAAMAKPAVVVAGGREHYTWEAYNQETRQRNMAYAAGLFTKPPGRPEDWARWSPKTDPGYVEHPFTPHRYLHTINRLPCCNNRGCWRPHVREDKNPKRNCLDVVEVAGRPLPRCMDMITVDQVVEAVLAYEAEMAAPEPLRLNLEPKTVELPVVDPVLVKPPAKDSPVLVKPAKLPPSPAMIRATRNQARQQRVGGRIVVRAPRPPVNTALTFPLTVFVLGYGDYPDLIRRCLENLYQYTDPGLFNVRIGLNEPFERTADYVRKFAAEHSNVEAVYTRKPQAYKYPLMREMFYDTSRPIKTDWVLWFDDDSYVCHPEWLNKLGARVQEKLYDRSPTYPRGIHMYGHVWYWHLQGRQLEWIRQATWYSGKPPKLDKAKNPPQPKVEFCNGGFWLITYEALRACDWPDPRLRHRGGDVMLAEALRQKGYGVTEAMVRDYVKGNTQPTRGFNETPAGIK